MLNYKAVKEVKSLSISLHINIGLTAFLFAITHESEYINTALITIGDVDLYLKVPFWLARIATHIKKPPPEVIDQNKTLIIYACEKFFTWGVSCRSGFEPPIKIIAMLYYPILFQSIVAYYRKFPLPVFLVWLLYTHQTDIQIGLGL